MFVPRRAIPLSRRFAFRAECLAILLLAFVLPLTGCGATPEPLPPSRRELIELASSVRSIVETAVVDVGEPSAREHLESGWGGDETSPEGSFAWSGGEAASLRFEVVDPRDTTLALRGWSFPFDDDGGQTVTALLNGRELAGFALERAPTVVRLPVAGSRLLAGENRLELRPQRWLEREGELPWAAGWDLLRLQESSAAGAPRFAPDGELVLPARTALSWNLVLPAGAWLAWDGVERSGRAWLEVAARSEGGSERASEIDAGGRLSLTRGEGALVELSFRARGDEGVVRLRGARLHQPVLDAARVEGGERDRSTPRPNLVVYVIDTLRADHLGCYGYERPTSPRIDAFAEEGVRWRQARAQSSWTKPAMATLLTGYEPVLHGADRRSRGIAPGIESVAARLAPAGYESAFFTTNPTVTAEFGFDRGFDHYHFLSRRVGRRRNSVGSREIHRRVVDWLDRRDPQRPFLLVVHTLDPHDPYLPGREYRERFAPEVDPQIAGTIRPHELAALSPAEAEERARQMRALYDGEIAQNDESFGALLDELARRDLLDRSAVLLTADHGEEFYDHGGWRHASTLYEEVVRIPLVLRLPGGAYGGRVVDAPADQIDVVPTLLELAGVPAPIDLPGGSWLPALAGGPAPDEESIAWLAHPSFTIESVTRGGWKWIRTRGAWRPPLARGGDELFDLVRDPRELVDLTRDRPLRRYWLAQRFAAALAERGEVVAGPEVAIDPELERSLRALGYL